MPPTRRVVKKLEPVAAKSFDERLWPVNVALLVFTGFAAGIIFVVFRGEETWTVVLRWTILAALAATVSVSIWALRRLHATVGRRGFQLSFVLSLIFHLAVLVLLASWVPLVAKHVEVARMDEKPPEVRKELTPLEYHIPLVNVDPEHESEFQKPVPMETPQPSQETLNRDRDQAQQTRVAAVGIPEPDGQVQLKPHLVHSQQIAENPPQQHRLKSELSRAAHDGRPASSTSPVEVPVADQPERQPSDQLDAQRSQLARSEERPAELPATAEPASSETSRPVTVAVSRRQMQRDAPNMETVPSALKRTIDKPNRVARAALADADSPAASKKTEQQAFKPNTTTLRRQIATSSQTTPENPEPLPVQPAQLANRPVDRQRSDTPSLAETQTPRRPLARRSTKPVPPTVVVTADGVELPVPSPTTPNQPSPSTVARRREAELVEADQPQAVELATVVEPATPSPARALRQSIDHAPSSHPSEVELQQLARGASDAPQPTPATTSPLERAGTDTTVSLVEQDRSVAPNRTGLQRADQGTEGVEVAPNLDRSLPADRRLSQVALASARRAQATQTAKGPAMAPSEPAPVPRARSGAAIPGAALVAADLPATVAAGSARPDALEASSSLAEVRAFADVDPDNVTAATGTVDVDIEPQRFVSNSARERAADGGQPTPGSQRAAPPLARTSSQPSPSGSSGPIQVARLAGERTRPSDEPTAIQAASAGVATSAPSPSAEVVAIRGRSHDDSDPESQNRTAATDVTAPRTQRADSATDAESGLLQQQTGGLARSDMRSGPPKAAASQADLVAITGALRSTGSDRGIPLESEAAEPRRRTAGRETATDTETMAPVGNEIADAPSQQRDIAKTSYRRTAEPGKLTSENAATLVQRAKKSPSPAGVVEQNDASGVASAMTPRIDQTDSNVSAPAATGVARHKHLPATVQVPASEGPGGLAADYTPLVGTIVRHAIPDSDVIHQSDVRFLRQRSTAPPSLRSNANIAAPGYRGRLARRRGDQDGGAPGRPGPQTEKAIERGLMFLAQHQAKDGSWSLHNYAAGKPYQDPIAEGVVLHSDTAATGLALLAFLGAGYHHQDEKYRDVVGTGIEHLIRFQQDDGNLFLTEDDRSNMSVSLYSHGIATIALCEAYGMTLDARIGEAAQKAIDFIAKTQHPERGGWRYSPGRSTDTSVTGWMMMALKSGQLAHLDVPEESFEKIARWLDIAQASRDRRHLYVYNPYAPDNQEHGRKPTATMTSVGLLMRLYLGWRRDNPNVVAGGKYLMDQLPTMRRRDTYYWYYTTQVMFHMGGDYWETWYHRLHPLLMRTQVDDGPLAGSWDPRNPVPDRWGSHAGRLYMTTMNLMSLEVYYRHLPIYDDTGN